jgi:hypothetical protein
VFSRASLIHRLPRSARRDSLDTQRAFRPFGTDDQQGLSANPSGQLSGLVLHYPGVGNQLPLKQRIRLGEGTDSRAVADCGRRLDDRLRTASGAYLCPRWARQRGIRRRFGTRHYSGTVSRNGIAPATKDADPGNILVSFIRCWRCLPGPRSRGWLYGSLD